MDGSLSKKEKDDIWGLFKLSRANAINLTKKAGRQPVLPDGGSMSRGDVDVASYPKVCDLLAMSDEILLAARSKFARLHFNANDEKIGVDKVMRWSIDMVLPYRQPSS